MYEHNVRTFQPKVKNTQPPMFWYDFLKKQPRFSEIKLPFKSLRKLDANDGAISSWLPTTSDYFKVPPALEVKTQH